MSRERRGFSGYMKHAVPALGLLAVIGATDTTHAYPDTSFRSDDRKVPSLESNVRSKVCAFEEIQVSADNSAKMVTTVTAQFGENKIYEQEIIHHSPNREIDFIELNNRYYSQQLNGQGLFVTRRIEKSGREKIKGAASKIPSSQATAIFTPDERARCKDGILLPMQTYVKPDDLIYTIIPAGSNPEETLNAFSKELVIKD